MSITQYSPRCSLPRILHPQAISHLASEIVDSYCLTLSLLWMESPSILLQASPQSGLAPGVPTAPHRLARGRLSSRWGIEHGLQRTCSPTHKRTRGQQAIPPHVDLARLAVPSTQNAVPPLSSNEVPTFLPMVKCIDGGPAPCSVPIS